MKRSNADVIDLYFQPRLLNHWARPIQASSETWNCLRAGLDTAPDSETGTPEMMPVRQKTEEMLLSV